MTEPDDHDFAEEHPVTDRDSAAPPADVPVGGLGGRSGTSGHPQGGSEAQKASTERWWDGGPMPPRRREGPCQCPYRWGKYKWSGWQWWRKSTEKNCVDHGAEATAAVVAWQRSPEHRAAEADWMRRNRPGVAWPSIHLRSDGPS